MLLFVSINSMQIFGILHYTLGHSNLVKRIALLLFPNHFPHNFPYIKEDHMAVIVYPINGICPYH